MFFLGWMRDFIENKALVWSYTWYIYTGENKQNFAAKANKQTFYKLKAAELPYSSLVIWSCVVLAQSGVSMRMHAYSGFLDGIHVEFNWP